MQKVIDFATKAHQGQVRKYTGDPYISHPLSVSERLKALHSSATDDMIAAAILHDTVEDTEVTIEQISQEFGDDIAMLVYWLTDKSQKSDGNRKVRKAIDRQHIAEAPDDAQIIKLADLIDNTSSIVAHDKRFAQVYLDEKEALLNVMSDATKSTAIYEEAQRVLFFGKQKLSEE